jgi:hypothetical protein
MKKTTANPAHSAKVQDFPRKAHAERPNAIGENLEIPVTTSVPHRISSSPDPGSATRSNLNLKSSPPGTVSRLDIDENSPGRRKRPKKHTFRKHRSTPILGSTIEVSGHVRTPGIKTQTPVEKSSNEAEGPS